MPPSFLAGSRRACLALAPVLAGISMPFAACSEGESTLIDTFAVTSVSVAPERFLGGVACGEGGMRQYVATLTDVTGTTEGESEGVFVLPSSAPVPCFREVRFERVVIGREYAANIQGYDREDIVPLGCYPNATPGCEGSSVMVDAATGEYVAPRWTTSCGYHRTQPGVDAGPPPASYDAGARSYLDCRGRAPASGQKPWLDGPVCVLDLITIPVRGCDPLKDSSAAP